MKKKGEIKLSILQEYENIRKEMGHVRYDAIGDYLKEVNQNRKSELFLSDVLYKEKEYEKFDKWFSKKVKPFRIIEHDNGQYTILLHQGDFWYDWKHDKKQDSRYGDGYCYEDAFYNYLKNNVNYANDLEYDSENGMVCIYTVDKKIADLVAYKLSKLYKDEKEMIKLIKQTKKEKGYNFSSKEVYL